MSTSTAHWDTVWADRDPDQVTWFQATPQRSLDLLRTVSEPGDAVVDIGGGASRLVDHLLDLGYRDVTVVDLAEAALAASRARLGERSTDVRWEVGDATTLELGRTFDVWHDRAVFHFLTDAGGRAAYIERLRAHLPIGGHVVMATFGPNGPERCSGLPTCRYSATDLATTLGPGFEPLRDEIEIHVSPAGVEQEFVYVLLCRSG